MAVVLGVLWTMVLPRADEEPPTVQATPEPVVAEPAPPPVAPPPLTAPGRVVARKSSTVTTKIAGTLAEVRVRVGDRVRRGQVVARLDGTEARTALREAESRLEEAVAGQENTRVLLQEARAHLERTEQLAGDELIPLAELEEARSAAADLEAKHAGYEAEIQAVGDEIPARRAQLEEMDIESTRAGIVVSVDARRGRAVAAGARVLTIADPGSLEILADVAEGDLVRVSEGQPVDVTAASVTIAGTVREVAVPVRIGIDEPDPRLLPDVAVEVTFRQLGSDPVTPSH